MTDLINRCDAYLASRQGCYEWRAIRYRAALDAMTLDDSHTVCDIGAGWTEFDYTLRAEGGFKGRYIPVDGGIDGTDLESWWPPRRAEWFVALEILEHLKCPGRLLLAMMATAGQGVILSTPNPETTDVLGMDPTHRTVIKKDWLTSLGFCVDTRSFYGTDDDSLFAVWYPPKGPELYTV